MTESSGPRNSFLRRLTFLLRPNWLILAAVVVGFAYLCFTVLAPWQLGKNTDTSHRNQLIAESVRADPVDVDTLLDVPVDTDSDTEWRRVTASGTYVPESTVLVRLRHLDGAPAYAVLDAFRLDDGDTLLIDRGLVAAVNGSQPPQISAPPTGRQELEARVRASEGVAPGKDPMSEDGYRQVYSVDTGQLAGVLDLELTPVPTREHDGITGGYLQLTEDQPGAFTPTPLPQLDAGPYLSYGLQWLAFGIMAPLGLGYFVWAEIRQRRRERADPAADPTPATSTAQSDNTPTPPTTEQRLADRYGTSHR